MAVTDDGQGVAVAHVRALNCSAILTDSDNFLSKPSSSGSAAGTFDSTVPTAANKVNENDAIEFINSGASDTTCATVFFADIRKS